MPTKTITCPQGKVRGLIEKDFNGRDFYNFQGIPFAHPPIGPLRFQPPKPLESWGDQEWDATYARQNCFQIDFDTRGPAGSEDCLYLNVSTPELAPKKPLPVMVWIHGGGYQMGSINQEQYGPEFLMTQDVVVVAIAHRLNVFGFFALSGHPTVTGNQGLKDQVEGLRWVQKSIRNFGGDPNNVTIFGESAGSGCTQLHTVSPLSKGLFHKVIGESGSGLNTWGFLPKYPATLARHLAKMGGTATKQLEVMLGLTTEQLFALHVDINQDFNHTEHFYSSEMLGAFNPIAEPVHDGAFITDHPRRLLQQGKMHNVPYLCGYNETEGFMFAAMDMPGIPKCKHESLVPRDLAVKFNEDPEVVRKLEEKIKRFYFGDLDPFSSEAKSQLATYRSDAMFNNGILETIRFACQTHPLYFYHFTVKAKANFITAKFGAMLPPDMPAVCTHADEMTYIFKASFVPKEIYAENSVELKTMQRMVTLWTNFAKEGNPTVKDLANVLDGVKWSRCGNVVQYLEIDNDGVRMVTGVPDEERVTFWDELYALKV